LSESRDPEAVQELLSEYFAVARSVIERCGGDEEVHRGCGEHRRAAAGGGRIRVGAGG